jgi:tetratricopeptide (TPR) repeat protein
MLLTLFARRLLVGLPVVASCFALLPAAFAWELFSGSAAKSRPAANSAAAGSPGENAAQAGRGGPLFHGQQLHWPTMPFGRSKPKPKVPENRAYTAGNRTAPYAANQSASRVRGTTSGPATRSPQRMNYNPSAAPIGPQHTAAPVARSSHENGVVNARNQVAHASYPPAIHRPIHPAQAMRGSHEATPALGQVAPYHEVGPAAGRIAVSESRRPDSVIRAASPERARPPAASSNATPSEPTAAVAAAPESPADRFIAQAHEWSGSAQTEVDYTRIIEACRRARASQPSSDTGRYASELASWAFNRRGQLRAEAGRHQEALVDFDDAVRADPGRWRAIHNRGMLLAQSGAFERAFDDFTRTIQLKPDFAKAYSNRAALLMVAGDLETAVGDYRRAIELDPALAVAHRGCGRACHLLRQLDAALEHYNEAVRLAPEDAYAVASRADLLTDLGRYAEAIAEYERTIELDPKSAHAYSSYAWLLATCPDASLRNSELAIEQAKLAIELSGAKNAVSFDTLAAAQANAGDFSAAMQTVRRAVQLAPPEEREIYEARLVMYQRAKPYRIAPVGEVMQASYESY